MGDLGLTPTDRQQKRGVYHAQWVYGHAGVVTDTTASACYKREKSSTLVDRWTRPETWVKAFFMKNASIDCPF